ncbi:helix-turn-helix transcriptional regulator [Methylovorus glucosotrophus]|uniref:Phage transcriptional regulator, AlpA n=1 Tax=Methylovorus glucosotrophus (strain SIP3-4) TaxID=582744 RepID=C6XEE2_METGS|nr:AlpA family phage regulatory protein [Methylovorus glucosotrophus]ACT50917.1 phage transcriptional regulator, AlpA [Methylovorus glucosotrophus SIP3-4]
MDKIEMLDQAVQNKDRLIGLAEVSNRVGKGRSTIYERIKNKTFPAPVEPGLWLESEIDQYIDDLRRARDLKIAANDEDAQAA